MDPRLAALLGRDGGEELDPRLAELLGGEGGLGDVLSQMSQVLEHAPPELVREAAASAAREMGLPGGPEQMLEGAGLGGLAGQRLGHGQPPVHARSATATSRLAWTAGIASSPPPFAPWRIEQCRHHYAAQLTRLEEMGFPEKGPGLRALIANGGDVELAAAIMESQGQAAADERAEGGGAELEAESEVKPDAGSKHAQPWYVGLELAPYSVAPPQLCTAVLDGDVATVRSFLAQVSSGPPTTARLWFVSDDVPAPGLFELLRVAAVQGHAELCRVLILEGGADVEQAVDGCTPLYHAAWSGQLEALQVLHGAGADLNSVLYTEGWELTGAGATIANGRYLPVTLPHYSGTQAFGNGEVVLFRWQQRHWVLSHLGAGLYPSLTGSDSGLSRLAANHIFDEGNWLYRVAVDRANLDQPPLRGWNPFGRGATPAPVLSAATSSAPSSPGQAESLMGSPLWQAANQGHHGVVRYLLTHGVPLTAAGPKKETAEQLAQRKASEHPAVEAVFEGARFWAEASLKQVQEILSTEEIVHTGFTCDRSGRSPIVGARYHKRGFDYDICGDEFVKLAVEERALYECVETTPPLIFDDHTSRVRLCQSLGRQDLLSFLELQGEVKRVRSKQRLAWAVALLSDEICDAGFDLDILRRVSDALNAIPLPRDGCFALKCLREECKRGAGTSTEDTIRIRRYDIVERQLQPQGVIALEEMLSVAGLKSTTRATLLEVVQHHAHSPEAQKMSGNYRCLDNNGVAIRAAPTQVASRKHGPVFGEHVSVDFIVDGADGIPYLQLSDGGYCALRITTDGPELFERVGVDADAAAGPSSPRASNLDLLESPGIAIQLAKIVAASDRCKPKQIGAFEWRRFQRYASVWPGRPCQLGSRLELAPELQVDPSLASWVRIASLQEYNKQLAATGMDLHDVPFVTEAELASVCGITKPFHKKRFLRHATKLPVVASVVASAEVITQLHCPQQSDEGHPGDQHLLGNSTPDRLFADHIVSFRRIRQLVDTSQAAELARRKNGKFCGRFCAGGADAEKAQARDRWFARLANSPVDIRAGIEALWNGTTDLARLQEGVDHWDGKRLIELIVHADDDVFDEAVTREYHDDEPQNAGAGSAQAFFDKHIVGMRRIRQLADPERALQLQPRFNQNGIEAERKEVRELNLPVWQQIGWPLTKPIERLWAGERELDVIARGCDENTRALVQLILDTDDNEDVGAIADRRHRETLEQRRAEQRQRGQGAGGSQAERLFHEHLVAHRRIRQLADPVRALSQQPRFNQDGVEAERQEVRESILPNMVRTGWNIGPAIEAMWAGERDLAVLTRGRDPNESRLIELILEADQPQYAAEASREHNAQHEARRAGRAGRAGADVERPNTPATPDPEIASQMEAVREQGRLLIMQAGFSTEQAAYAVQYLTNESRFERAVRDGSVDAQSLATGSIEYLLDHPEVGQAPRVENDGGRARLKCPHGHPIALNATTHHHRHCDRCSSRGPAFHRCEGCDYDLCAACFAATSFTEEAEPPGVVDAAADVDVDAELYGNDNAVVAPNVTSAFTVGTLGGEEAPREAPREAASMAEMRARRLARFG